jgi:hypothetical protein
MAVCKQTTSVAEASGSPGGESTAVAIRTQLVDAMSRAGIDLGRVGGAWCQRSALAVCVAVAFAAAPAGARAQEPLSGYSTTAPPPPAQHEEPPPAKPPTLKPKPRTSETSPSEEVPRPEQERPVSQQAEPPPPQSLPARSARLPFTGWDLRWQLGFALLVIGAGAAILGLQRRGATRRAG